MRIKIFTAKRPGINRWGARKWADVPSRSQPGTFRKVIKLRKRGTRNYRYACSCPDFTNRQLPCWHINQFKKEEDRILHPWIRAKCETRVKTAVHPELGRHGYCRCQSELWAEAEANPKLWVKRR